MPSKFYATPDCVVNKGATATRYHGKGRCWMCSFDRKHQPVWECSTKGSEGRAFYLLCAEHGESWIKSVKAKVVQ